MAARDDDEAGGKVKTPRAPFDRGDVPEWRLNRDMQDRRRAARKKLKRKR